MSVKRRWDSRARSSNTSTLHYIQQPSFPLGLQQHKRWMMLPASSPAWTSGIKSCSIEKAEVSHKHSGTSVSILGQWVASFLGQPSLEISEHPVQVLSVFHAVRNSKLLLSFLWVYRRGPAQRGSMAALLRECCLLIWLASRDAKSAL